MYTGLTSVTSFPSTRRQILSAPCHSNNLKIKGNFILSIKNTLSCTDAIFTVQSIIEKRKEHNLPLFLSFIDYEKAYDNINRAKVWEMMDNKIPNYLLNTIKCNIHGSMYLQEYEG